MGLLRLNGGLQIFISELGNQGPFLLISPPGSKHEVSENSASKICERGLDSFFSWTRVYVWFIIYDFHSVLNFIHWFCNCFYLLEVKWQTSLTKLWTLSEALNPSNTGFVFLMGLLGSLIVYAYCGWPSVISVYVSLEVPFLSVGWDPYSNFLGQFVLLVVIFDQLFHSMSLVQ